MKKIPYLCILFLFALLACTSSVKNYVSQDLLEDYPELKKSLGTRKYTPQENFFILNKSTDSTCRITWGNKKISRRDSGEVDFYLANRLHYQWENTEYLILKAGTGSGVWINVVLPFAETEKVRIFDNMLCFDPVDNLVALQYYGDTALVLQNLKTAQKQFIVLETPCEAASNLYCIDSIGIKGKELYLKWTTPYLTGDTSRIVEEKRILIKI